MTTFKIDLDGQSTGNIEIDGQDVAPQAARVFLAAVPGKPPELKVQFVHGLVVDGAAEIRLATSTRAALVALGWTPPPTGDDGEPPA